MRPLARRRDNTAWPLLVFMRCRNPCTLARRRRLGWNVRLGIGLTAPASKNLDEQRESINDGGPFGQTGLSWLHLRTLQPAFFARSAPSPRHCPISLLTNRSRQAKVKTLRRKNLYGAARFACAIRASIRLRLLFFWACPTASAIGISRSAPISFTGFFVVPVRLNLFSDDIFENSVQPSPSRAATLAAPLCVRPGSSRA